MAAGAWPDSCERLGMRLNLKRLGLLAGKAARVFAARAELTPQRIDLMLLLRGAPLSQRQIAERLCVCGAVVSRIVDALVELELVERLVPVDDRRLRIPRLTVLGVQRLARCFPRATRHGAQDVGERTWLRAWRSDIATLGIHVDNILRSRTPDFFRAMAMWNACFGRGLFLRNEISYFEPEGEALTPALST